MWLSRVSGRQCVHSLGVVACCLGAAFDETSAQRSGAAAEVEAREIAFAQTMADRDLEAFVTFLSPEAVFFAGEQPLRGVEAIERAWAPFFQAPDAPFSWRPDTVEVLEDPMGGRANPVAERQGQEPGE